jgi:glucosamine kinase
MEVAALHLIRASAKRVIEITVAYYLGIDGGGSKTTCAIGDENEILASATTGPSNITRVGEESARDSMHEAIRTACAAAKVSPQQISATCVGAAGAAREEVAWAVRRFVTELVSGQVEVVGDMAIALEAAFGAASGVIVIAGTGSIAYGRDASGNTARAGGWGFSIGDEGSAYWIGRQALTRLLRAADESGFTAGKEISLMASPLVQELRQACDVNSLEQLARKANFDLDFAALFPAVDAAAASGDKLAQGVLDEAAAELARLAEIIVCRLFPKKDWSAAVSLAMAGGVFRHSQTIRRNFSARICARDTRITPKDEIVEPVYGALQMARKCMS